MHLLALLAMALAGTASAGFALDLEPKLHQTDSAKLSRMQSEYNKEMDAFYATFTTASDVYVAYKVFDAYLLTAKDIPAIVTATTAMTTYTTLPDWYNNAPKTVRDVYGRSLEKEKNVIDDLNRRYNDAPGGMQKGVAASTALVVALASLLIVL